MSRGTPRPQAIGDHLLTLKEAAAVLRLNPRTVREYLRRGEIEGRIYRREVEISTCRP